MMNYLEGCDKIYVCFYYNRYCKPKLVNEKKKCLNFNCEKVKGVSPVVDHGKL